MAEVSRQSKKFRWHLSAHCKGLTAYFMLQVVVILLLLGVRLTSADSIVIYAQSDKSDFMQVFFPIGGAYSEENSKRSELVENKINRIKITLPRTSIDHVRIDPLNDVGEIFITKIEFRNFLFKKIYTPKDLVAYSKPISMIDKFEVINSGLIIHSTGNDPVFELKINKASYTYQFIVFSIVSILISTVLFFFILKLPLIKMPKISSRLYILAIPLLISLVIAALFYPGFMSYDTLHALRSARNGVTDSMWPPMVSYVWRAVDIVSLNPSAMHFMQVLLLISSIFFIVFFSTKKISYSTIFLFFYLSIPVVLGTLAVIWKDVLMAAFFLAGFAVIMSMRIVINSWGIIFLSLLATFLIFLGVCSRHNAIAGAVPLLFYLALIMCSRVLKTPLRLWFCVILFGSTLTGAVFFTKTQLDNYSLPGFVKLNNSNDVFIQSVRVLDVAGASLCVGSNLFGDIAPNLSLDEIRSGYDPRHLNLSKGLLDSVGVDNRINKIWFGIAVSHPICFFNNKFQLTKYMIGANNGDQFLITHPLIDNNEYKYSLPESSIRDSIVTYIFRASHLHFFKPWFLYLISIAFFIYLIRIGALTADYLIIFLSGFFYFASLVAFGNAADARLPFYTTTTLAIFAFFAIFEFKGKRCK